MNAKDFDEIVGARLNWCMKTLCAKGDIVPDKSSRSTLPSGCLGRICGRGDDDEWRPCPEDGR